MSRHSDSRDFARTLRPRTEIPRSSDSVLSRLCRYYNACLGYDDENGVSIFDSNAAKSTNYIELKSLPGPRDSGVFDSEAAQELIGKLQQDRHLLTLYLGYPVVLSKQKTANAQVKGFSVEPVFLCPVEFDTGRPPRISTAPPFVNLAVLKRFTAAEGEALIDELVALEKELGLIGGLELPSLGELGRRLVAIRPDWPWKEMPRPAVLVQNPPLHQVYPDGIFNRAVLATSPRSPYTQGLEAELKLLERVSAGEYAGTALGHCITGRLPAAIQIEDDASIEVLPLNREQREAVKQALTSPLTVITGPPGTGKSQVVVNLLIDAVWQGKRVLFASKNHKAVEVVEARLNALAPRPVVLRVGTRQHQLELAEYLGNLLVPKTGLDDRGRFDENLRRHAAIHKRLGELREDERVLSVSQQDKQSFMERLLWKFYWKGHLKGRSLADIAQERNALFEKLSRVSQKLWSLWVKLQPISLPMKDRQLLKQYNALLKMVIDMGSSHVLDERLRKQYHELFPKIGHLLSCWAATSLSVRGRVPFEPRYFDLVVFDEASQCDIASALPLLYRAKAAVIIGDPKQLSHISCLQREQDQRLLGKFELAECPHWAYSINSLFDLVSGFVPARDIVILRDHYRSHADIIQFSNEFFYEAQLRVMTAHQTLKSPNPNAPSVRWISVEGEARRPSSGSAVNLIEARAVVEELKRLVLYNDYSGTVGVVSPFREQANAIREEVLKDEALALKLAKADFLCETVHKFQGDERDLIIFSPVVSQGIAPTALNFLRENGNLFNVAITRARAALIVVGNRDAAMESEVEYLVQFARYARTVQESRRRPAYIVPIRTA